MAESPLQSSNAAVPCADADAFVREYPIRDDVCCRLWELLDGTDAVLLELPASMVQNACDLKTKPARRVNRGVVANVTSGGRNNGRSYEICGASVCDVHDLLVKRDRAEQRLSEVESGERDEDPEELERVIETLTRRATARNDLDTSFRKFWVTESAIENAYLYSDPAEAESSGFQQASLEAQ